MIGPRVNWPSWRVWLAGLVVGGCALVAVFAGVPIEFVVAIGAVPILLGAAMARRDDWSFSDRDE